jgi:regulatory protein
MDDEIYQQLMNASLRLLSIRPRSNKEIADYLYRKTQHEHDDVVDRVIMRLTELGYADDLKFAGWFTSQRQSRKPKGDRFIENELKQKGVSPDIIDTVLKSSDAGSQKDLAIKSVSRKIHLWGKLPLFEFKNKIYTFLARQGFDQDTIRAVIDETIQKSYNNGDE